LPFRKLNSILWSQLASGRDRIGYVQKNKSDLSGRATAVCTGADSRLTATITAHEEKSNYNSEFNDFNKQFNGAGGHRAFILQATHQATSWAL
jgi:hypothetical protein